MLPRLVAVCGHRMVTSVLVTRPSMRQGLDASRCQRVCFSYLQEETQQEGQGLWSPVRAIPSSDAEELGKAQVGESGGAQTGEAIAERFPAIPSLQ